MRSRSIYFWFALLLTLGSIRHVAAPPPGVSAPPAATGTLRPKADRDESFSPTHGSEPGNQLPRHARGDMVIDPTDARRALQQLYQQRNMPLPTSTVLPSNETTHSAAPAPPVQPLALPPISNGTDETTLPPLPEYIVVGRTYTTECIIPAHDLPVQRVLFVEYLRNVLPNEWVASWPAPALDAGAIAARQFAWHTVVVERKWRAQGYPFDVVDSTCDQVYRDASADPRTDAALQRTWGTVLTRNGTLLPMYYRDTEATCGGRPDCMGQVESAILASAGHSSLQILARSFAAPRTAVRSIDARLPAHLPPVPPAPPVLKRPNPTATPPLAAHRPSPTATPTDGSSGTPAVQSPTEQPSVVAKPTARATATPTATPTSPPPSTIPQTTIPTAPHPTSIPPTATPSLSLPNMIGLGENQAREVLSALGIRVVFVDYHGKDRIGEQFDQIPPHIVVSHTPSPGTPVKPNMVVVLGVRAP